jgi:TRAP transporter TAXI family solute receptor
MTGPLEPETRPLERGAGAGAPRRPGRRTVLAAAGAAAVAATAGITVERRRTPPGPAQLTLATGPQGAVFLEVGRDLGRAIEAVSPGTRVTVQITAATVDNLRLLLDGAADLAFASLDAAADASAGPRGLLAVSRLYDSVLHLVVAAGSPIVRLADLTGRRVSVGATDSGTEFSCLRLMRLAGVRPDLQLRLAQTPAMKAVAAGIVDAAFSLTGFPTPAITELALRQPIRLIPLADEVPALDHSLPGVYGPAAIPEGTYRGTAVTETVFVPNLLLARPGLADPAVALVAAALLAPASRRFWSNPDSRRIDVRTAIATGPVPMHPASLAWLRAHKP